MTPYEMRLLDLLKASAGSVVTHEEILAGLYPDGLEPGRDIIKVFVRHLRKAGADIRTAWGRGYYVEANQ